MGLSKRWLAVILFVGLGAALSRSTPVNSPRSTSNAGPVFEESDLFVAGTGGYACYRIPALVVSTKGTILAFCEARKYNCKDWDQINLVVKRSRDSGQHWDAQRVIASDGSHTVNQPTAVADRDTGAVFLVFCEDNQRVLVMHSTDEGTTWSKPVEITRQVAAPAWRYMGSGPGHGIQLKSGRLLIPAWADTSPGPAQWAPNPSWGKVQFSYTFYSDDHGASWKRGEALESDLSDECEVVEAADGRVYMNMRSRQEKHRRAWAWSRDGGVTWSKVKFDEALPEPSCQGSVIRFSERAGGGKNRVLLANPASTAERSKLTVRVSYDECQTWPVSKVVQEGSSGYSDLAIAPDGNVLCLYEQFLPSKKLILARFNLAWLTNGNDRPGQSDGRSQ